MSISNFSKAIIIKISLCYRVYVLLYQSSDSRQLVDITQFCNLVHQLKVTIARRLEIVGCFPRGCIYMYVLENMTTQKQDSQAVAEA